MIRRVTSAVSGKTSYLVVGEEAGESKIKKAKSVKVPTINEDEFYDLIKTLPAKSGDCGVPLKGKGKATAKLSVVDSPKKTKLDQTQPANSKDAVEKAPATKYSTVNVASLTDE
jgi:replication factor C subunit 1